MFIVRPARRDDLGGLKEMAATEGMTTLPDDETALNNRITDSLRAFDERVRKPGGESYLFVLEDSSNGQIIGTSGIVSKVGGFDPYYTFKISSEAHACEELNVRNDIPILEFTVNHNGPSEIGGLFLNPRYRKLGLARLLSLCRFLFMAGHPGQFDRTVISELRGVVDETGRSPFWENVGKHFFDTDFRTADLLSGTGRKEFIAKLMPRHPIYIPLLRDPARAAIGRVHPYTKPALSLLRGEGFAFNSEVDVFDAGPTVSALLDDIRIVREIRTGTVGNPDDGIESAVYIIGNSSIAFRACFGPVGENSDGSIALARETMDGLRVKPGDTVSFSPARPRKGKK